MGAGLAADAVNGGEFGLSFLDAGVLVVGGLLALGSWLLLRWARAVDDALADLGGED